MAHHAGSAPAGLLVYATGWTYLFLCDATRYFNHAYLFLLVAILLLLFELSQSRYLLYLLRAQFSIVYFYAGLVKSNAEWLLRHEPLRTYIDMATSDRLATLRPLIDDFPWLITAAALFSAIFDLLVGFLLWNKTWRRPAIALCALFHLTNAVLFETIGSFPFVSLASCLLFLPEEDSSKAAAAKKTDDAPPKRVKLSASKRLQLGLAGAWLLAQALLPLRHHLHSSDVSWTKLGNEFCWRLMADTTDGWISLEIVVEDAAAAARARLQRAPELERRPCHSHEPFDSCAARDAECARAVRRRRAHGRE